METIPRFRTRVLIVCILLTLTGVGPLPAVAGGPDSAAPTVDSRADLAMTDLFAQSLPRGVVAFRVINNGPDQVRNTEVGVMCQTIVHASTASVTSKIQHFFTINVNQDAGQTIVYPIGLTVDTSQHWYDVTCTLLPPFNHPDPENNSFSQEIPPPP
jgi:hypothetical protein